MAFEDGFNRRVTVQRRQAGSETTWLPVGTDVEVRVSGLKAGQIQAIASEWSRRASHGLLAGIAEDILEGDRVEVTEFRAAGGAWDETSDAETFEVVLIETAEGGAGGPHHLRGYLSRATRTG